MYKNKPSVWDRVTDFFALWLMRLVGCVLVIYHAVTPSSTKESTSFFKNLFKRKEKSQIKLTKCLCCNVKPELLEEISFSEQVVVYRLMCNCKRTKPFTIRDHLISKWNSAVFASAPKERKEIIFSPREQFPTSY